MLYFEYLLFYKYYNVSNNCFIHSYYAKRYQIARRNSRLHTSSFHTQKYVSQIRAGPCTILCMRMSRHASLCILMTSSPRYNKLVHNFPSRTEHLLSLRYRRLIFEKSQLGNEFSENLHSFTSRFSRKICSPKEKNLQEMLECKKFEKKCVILNFMIFDETQTQQ